MALKSKTLLFLATVIGIAALSTGTFAQETTTPAPEKKADKAFKRDGMAGREFGRRHGKHRGFGLRGLNLTADQKAKLRSIREANKPDQATITELRAIRDARRAGTELTADQKARLQAFRERSRTKGRELREQIMGILTAEQKARLETRRTEMRERFKNRKFDRPERPKRPAPPTVEKTKTI